MMSWLQSILMRLYGTSKDEQDERTRRTASAVRERAEQRREELGASTVDYSRSVVDAYRASTRQSNGNSHGGGDDG